MRTAIAVFALMGIISGAHAMTELEAALNTARESLEASVVKMNDALALARGACVGISSELNTLKSLAIAGTGVSAAGATTATVATVAGAKKVGVDAAAMKMTPYKEKWGTLNEQNKNSGEWTAPLRSERTAFDNWFAALQANDEVKAPFVATHLQKYRQGTEMGKRGKKLGDIRTGTMAASAALNVVGATVSGMDMKRSGNLSERVSECLAATRELNTTWGQVRIHKMIYDSALQQLAKDTNATENMVISNAEIARVETIVRVCDEWSTINMSKIDNRATGALASSVVGAATGTAGTITSVLANTETRHLSGTSKEENLNKASNILAGTTAVAGGTATIFNATQISAIKRASTVADACEGALK